MKAPNAAVHRACTTAARESAKAPRAPVQPIVRRRRLRSLRLFSELPGNEPSQRLSRTRIELRLYVVDSHRQRNRPGEPSEIVECNLGCAELCLAAKPTLTEFGVQCDVADIAPIRIQCHGRPPELTLVTRAVLEANRDTRRDCRASGLGIERCIRRNELEARLGAVVTVTVL